MCLQIKGLRGLRGFLSQDLFTCIGLPTETRYPAVRIDSERWFPEVCPSFRPRHGGGCLALRQGCGGGLRQKWP